MIKYIVSWCLLYQVPTECPDSKQKDQYGREFRYGVCAVYHTKILKDCDHRRVFTDRGDAYSFYGGIVSESQRSIMLDGDIVSIKLDSTQN